MLPQHLLGRFTCQCFGSEIKSKICKMSIFFRLVYLIEASSNYVGSCDYQSSKFEILKPLPPFKYHFCLQKSIMVINLLFVTKFCVIVWIPNFEILSRSRVMSHLVIFDFLKLGIIYESNICNKHKFRLRMGRQKNVFDIKFAFSVKFYVEWYMIIGDSDLNY